jgi:hypothetical protein
MRMLYYEYALGKGSPTYHNLKTQKHVNFVFLTIQCVHIKIIAHDASFKLICFSR